MTFEEYQKSAKRTRSDEPDIVTAALGLTGEAGEFADHVKKWWAQGHDLDEIKLVEELGDILWYVSLAADYFFIDLDKVARLNIEKLRARYPDGFTAEASVNRHQKFEPCAQHPEGGCSVDETGWMGWKRQTREWKAPWENDAILD